jgi:hypothetical protein
MKMVNKKYIYILFFSVMVILSMLIVSCGSPAADATATSKIDVGSEPMTDDEMLKALEEAIVEEDLTDYDNVRAAAELKGAIPNFLCTNSDNYIKVEVTNTSDFTWRKDGPHSVRIGYHYFGQDVEYSEYDKTRRTGLPDNLEPNESTEVLLLIDDITNPGTYILQIDIVLEGKYWFSSQGMEMIEGPVLFGECSS